MGAGQAWGTLVALPSNHSYLYGRFQQHPQQLPRHRLRVRAEARFSSLLDNGHSLYIQHMIPWEEHITVDAAM